MAYQDDPGKKYSLYIPSNYHPSKPHALMLAFHPFSPSQWNASSWRDTLTTFAETNGLILLCPDGGPDGKVDDRADTAFTTFLLDQLPQQYNIDAGRMYVMGFSWGGRVVYTYGLKHADRFAGFMPVGAAIDGTQGFADLLSQAYNKPFYLVHGGADVPHLRYHPVKDSLENQHACVNSTVLAGVGHTFDFPNRNTVLSTAFQQLQSTVCTNAPVKIDRPMATGTVVKAYPNPSERGAALRIEWTEVPSADLTVRLYDAQGNLVHDDQLSGRENQIDIASEWASGIYALHIEADDKRFYQKLVIR